MKEEKYKTLEDCIWAINFCKDNSFPIPVDLQRRYDELTAETTSNSDTPIYDTLVANYPFGVMPQEKKDCIEQTVARLLEEGPGAEEPGLLLGKIQCGKTDTFEDIIGLAFDKGIDICVVLTKGTRPLTQQTIKRMKKDFECLNKNKESIGSIEIMIYDILELWKNVKPSILNSKKTVIVCKKEKTNLEHLTNMFQKNNFLREKKVLIVDDEADFASRNYRSTKRDSEFDKQGKAVKQTTATTMAKISQQIDEFRGIPAYCRYLQVTATPYCLYLQPNGELNLGTEENKNIVKPFRPRFTSLVPTHDLYVGGHEYFELSQDSESMYSHLYNRVEQKCINVMRKPDQRYLNSSIASKNIQDLTYAIITYFMATAIRCIQRNNEGKRYCSSALIHVEIDKKNHSWQSDIVEKLINSISNVAVNDDKTDLRVWKAFETAYISFEESNRKGRVEGLITTELPEREAVKARMREIFEKNEYHVQVVNSDEQVPALLDEKSGELKLETTANIFIGGNILDRGVTIKNMLCFFYGRNPKNFQQDTVLQHARMYGARSKEDMAVTRFHTSEQIYQVLKHINELDNQLREWFIQGKDKQYDNAVFVGFDKNIKPCSPQKIKASNALVIKRHKRMLPVGFNTLSLSETRQTMAKIDRLIEASAQGKSKDSYGMWETDYAKINEILQLIEQTYDYRDCDKEHLNDFKHMLCALKHCIDRSGSKVFVMHRTDRNISRIFADGSWANAPEHGESERKPAQEKAIDTPVVMLFRENGKKENGWKDAPFYWPVLVAQKEIDSAIFTLEQKNKSTKLPVCPFDHLEGIDEREVLRLTYSGDFEEHFGVEGTEYDVEGGEYEFETRDIIKSTQGRYLQKDEKGNLLITPEAEPNKEQNSDVYWKNNGVFPFVLRPYKYMILTNGRDNKASKMFLEIADMKYWEVFSNGYIKEDGDLVIASEYKTNPQARVIKNGGDNRRKKDLSEVDDGISDITVWTVIYPIKRVLGVWRPTEIDSED